MNKTATLARAVSCDWHLLAQQEVPATYDIWTYESGGAYVCNICYERAGEPVIGVNAVKLVILAV